MKIYFLVEGKETEPKVYRGWLKNLLPELSEVQGFDEANDKNFFLRGARHKSPSFEKRLEASILEANQGNYDYLVICIDAEDLSIAETQQGIREILTDLSNAGVRFKNDQAIKFVVQNRCIETWFLGNRKVFKRNPQDPELRRYIQHFDVYEDDPESMLRPPDDIRFGSHAQFHYEYLRKMLAEKKFTLFKTRSLGCYRSTLFTTTPKTDPKDNTLKFFSLFL